MTQNPMNKFLNKVKPSFYFAHIILALAYIICIAFLYFKPTQYDDYHFRLTYGEDVPAQAQLYYDTGKSYSEEQCIVRTAENKMVDFPLNDAIRKHAIAFRIDPWQGTVPNLSLHSLSVVLRGKEIKTYTGQALKDLINITNDISGAEVIEDNVVLTITNIDPYFTIKDDFIRDIPNHVEEYNIYISRQYMLYASCLALFGCLLLCIFKRQVIAIFKKIDGLLKRKFGVEKISRIKSYWCAPTQKLSLIRVLLYLVSVALFLSTAAFYTLGHFLMDYFSGLSMQEIVFHLKVPMTGTATNMVAQYFEAAKVPLIVSGIVLIIIVSILALMKSIRNCRFASTVALLLSVYLLILSTSDIALELKVPEYLANQMKTSSFIEKNFVSPLEASITFPENKRNLIYIYLESMESTFISKQDGGCMPQDIIPELTLLAKDNVNFSESNLVGGGTSSSGSAWTAGAMVAMTSGLPLLLPISENTYGEYSKFMPGAISLGEILKKNGYAQEIMVGSDLSFGGRRNYFTQHGEYQVYDIFTARQKGDLPDDYYVWWGYEDEKLFSYAKEELTRLAKGNEPFNFTMLTADTHHVNGYLCGLCQSEHESQYANVLSCSSRQVASFITWLKAQNFYDNTTIILCGDHPSMDAKYIDSAYDGSKPRKVYNCFINATGDGTTSKNREFHTFDLFPTTLAAMGCEISGDRLGLGTNLFSEKKTLAETYGYEKIEEELSKRSRFYEKEILDE